MAPSAPSTISPADQPAPSPLSLSNTPSATRLWLTRIILVVAVVCLLATIFSLVTNPHQRRLVDDNALRQQQLTDLREALANYASAHQGLYPTTNGEFWCENCTYADYQAKGSDVWIPELVQQGYMEALPTDPANLHGTVCRPDLSSSFAGYVYYSPAPPHNTDYKLFAQCTPPAFALNQGSAAPQSPYCAERPPHDSSQLSANPFRDVALKPFVDPVRYEYAYAIYTPGLACL